MCEAAMPSGSFMSFMHTEFKFEDDFDDDDDVVMILQVKNHNAYSSRSFPTFLKSI